MIPIKTPEQIAIMKKGGAMLGKILSDLLDMSHVGVSLLDVEACAQERIKKAGGSPSFTTVEHYPFATCLCVNEEVVHAMPRDYRLKEGDIFTIDVGMIYEGFHTDTASSIIVGSKMSEDRNRKEQFLTVGEETLKKAIAVARPGNRVGHISKVIQESIEGAGYNVVKSLTGHGVGKQLHEEPMISEFLKGSVDRTALLTPGMTLAIEVIYVMGKGNICYAGDDGWALSTLDLSPSAIFEHSIAITDEKTLVLTVRQK